MITVDQQDSESAAFTCWCGDTGDPGLMFDDSALDESCGGLGTLYCYCGGDLCVCHHHGDVECPGCSHCLTNADGDPVWFSLPDCQDCGVCESCIDRARLHYEENAVPGRSP